MIFGAAYLAWDRWRDLPRGKPSRGGNPIIGLAIFAMSLAALLAGGLFFIRSLALVSTLLALTGIAWHLGGMRLLRVIGPSLLLLLVIVPPPGHLDETLTLRLQHVAVRGSSALLDLLRIPHVQSGSVLEIPGRRLLIEQACAGINSLMSIVGFTLLLGLYRRRALRHILLLLPFSFAFVIGANLVRITAEAWLKVRWNVDVLDGARHETLGMGLFFICATLVISLDALLEMLFHNERRSAKRVPTAPRSEVAAGLASPVWVSWIVALAFAATGLFVDRQVRGAWPSPTLRENAVFHLPAEIAGWSRVDKGDAATVERPQILAAKSTVWRFQRGSLVASVALDYPFVGYHELGTCYALSGWSIDDRYVQRPSPGTGSAFTRLRMNKSSIMQGELCFGILREDGTWLTSSAAAATKGDLGRMARWLAVARETATGGATYQVQALVQTYSPLSPDDQRDVERLFVAASESLAQQTLDQLGERR